MPPHVSEELSLSEGARQRKNGKGGSKKLKGRKEKEEMIFPREKAPFTVGDLRKAIPAECFEPTLRESFYHLFKDLLEISLYVGIMMYLDQPLWDFSPFVWGATWLLYTWMQGVVMTGVWVLAHECGHKAFSKSDFINDSVGFILHTALSVPYFSWQHTHAQHHHFTNNLQKDEVFVPQRKSEAKEATSLYKYIPQNSLFTLIQLVFMLLFGWPLYLLINSSSHKNPNSSFDSHFLPTSSIFSESPLLRFKVLLSNFGLVGWWYLLYLAGGMIGGRLLLRLYLLPLLVTNGFLVAITYMQHTHVNVPHYDDEEWTWLRGALCTVDRSMGEYLDNKLHLIHVTHVVHHLFPRIPFYRSHQAHQALLPLFSPFYHQDRSSFLLAMWRNVQECVFLEEGKGILFWLNETH